MNVPLTGLLGQLKPILKLVGLDKKVTGLGRDQIEPLFLAAVPRVVARLEKDGHTFAQEGDSAESESFLIRASMYLIAKDALSTKLPKGANLAADYLRSYKGADTKIVAIVAPQVSSATSMTALVELVAKEWLRLIF